MPLAERNKFALLVAQNLRPIRISDPRVIKSSDTITQFLNDPKNKRVNVQWGINSAMLDMLRGMAEDGQINEARVIPALD